MKKYSLLLFFLLILPSNGEILSLDNLISSYKQQSSLKEIQDISKEKIAMEKKSLYFNKYLDLKFNGNYRYIDSNDNDKKIYDLNFTYNNMYLKIKKEEKDSKEEISYGLSKSLNDLFYFSKNDYDFNNLKLKNELNDKTNEYKMNQDIIKIISNYIEILNINFDILTKLELLTGLNDEASIINEKIKIEEANSYDLDLLNIEIKNTKSEIDILKSILNNKINDMIIKTKLKIVAYEFAPITEYTPTNWNFSNFSLNEMNLNIKAKENELKYVKRNNQLEFSIFGDYDKNSKNWQAGITLNAKLINFKGDSKLVKEELKELSIKKIELVNDFSTYTNSLKNDYKSLETTYKYNKSKFEVSEKRFVKIKELYRMGYINLLDYLKELKEINSTKYNMLKSQNEFFGFTQKLRYF